MASKRRNRSVNQAKTTVFPSRVIMMFLALVMSNIRPTAANFEFTGVERNFAIGIENADDDDFILSRNGGGFFPKNLNRCRTITDIICEDEDFSTLCGALEQTGLDIPLDDEDSSWTLFAPTDAAFEMLPEHLENDVFESISNLQFVMLYHAVGGDAIFSNQLYCTYTITMANQKDTRTVCEMGQTFQKGAGNSRRRMPQIVDADNEACNGVVHVIDQVLLPFFLPDSPYGNPNPVAMPTPHPTKKHHYGKPKNTRNPTPYPTPFPTNHPTRTPTISPAPTSSPAPTGSPAPTTSPAPTQTPTISPAPTSSPAPTTSPAPSQTPTISPAPTSSPAPTGSFAPTLAPVLNTPYPTPFPTPHPIGFPSMQTPYPTPYPTSFQGTHNGPYSDQYYPGNVYPNHQDPYQGGGDFTCASIGDIICQMVGLELLCEAYHITGLFDYLQVGYEWTIFAPTNEAIEHMIASVPQGTLSMYSMTDILLFQMIETSAIEISDLPCEEWIEMTNGDFSYTHCRGSEKYQIGPGNGFQDNTIMLRDAPMVLREDIGACNGIIHTVDTVLLPSWWDPTYYQA